MGTICEWRRVRAAIVITDTPDPTPLSDGYLEFTPMLFHAAIACLTILSVSVLIAHAIDAIRT